MLITVNQAATIMKMKGDGVLKAIQKGTLPAKKYGRDWLIEKESLSDYMEHHRGKVGRKKQMAAKV